MMYPGIRNHFATHLLTEKALTIMFTCTQSLGEIMSLSFVILDYFHLEVKYIALETFCNHSISSG